jgi:hypothetical protein
MKLERATAPFTSVDPDAMPGSAAVAAEPSRKPADKRAGAREAMLSGPILPTLLRLALPTMVVLLARTAVNIS